VNIKWLFFVKKWAKTILLHQRNIGWDLSEILEDVRGVQFYKSVYDTLDTEPQTAAATKLYPAPYLITEMAASATGLLPKQPCTSAGFGKFDRRR